MADFLLDRLSHASKLSLFPHTCREDMKDSLQAFFGPTVSYGNEDRNTYTATGGPRQPRSSPPCLPIPLCGNSWQGEGWRAVCRRPTPSPPPSPPPTHLFPTRTHLLPAAKVPPAGGQVVKVLLLRYLLPYAPHPRRYL